MAGHIKELRKLGIDRNFVLAASAVAFCALVILAGAPTLGLWDPWEMNPSSVAFRMTGSPRVLLIDSQGTNGPIAAAIASDNYTIETPDLGGSTTKGLDILREKTSEGIYAAAVLEPAALVPDAASKMPDPGTLKTLANAIRSAASRNPSTRFILVSAGPRAEVDKLKEQILEAAGTTGDEMPVPLRKLLFSTSTGDRELAGMVDAAACVSGTTAHFKTGGRTAYLPPLESWITALWFKVFGYNEFSARFTGVLFALLTILMLMLPGRKVFGPRVASGAVFILSTSLLFSGTARFAGAGMPDVFLLAATCTAFGRLVIPGEKSLSHRQTILLWIATGIGFTLSWLSGGMTAAVTTAAVAGAWFLMNPDRRNLPIVGFIFLLLGVAAILTFVPESAWFRQFRFTAASFDGGLRPESRSFDFIVKEIGFGFFPWSAFIPVAIMMAATGSSRQQPERLLLILWAVVPMITAMIFVQPFGQTMYTGLPAMAILTALFFQDYEAKGDERGLHARLFGFFAIGLFLVIMKDMLKSPAPLVTFLTTDPMFSQPGKGDGGFPPTVAIHTIGKLALGLMLISMLSVASRVSDMVKSVQDFLAQRRPFLIAMIVMGALILLDIIIFIALKWRAITGKNAGPELVRIFLTGPDIAGLYLLCGLICLMHWFRPLFAKFSAKIGQPATERIVAAFDAFQTMRIQKPAFIVLSGVFSLSIFFGVIPELSYHLSQKHIVDSWKRAAVTDPGPLYRHGNFAGKGTQDTNFYTSNLEEISSRNEVTRMLADKSKRTFFLVPTKQFSEINSAWRDLTKERGLPVLDDRSSRIVLVTSRLADGETDRNWLARATLTQQEFDNLKNVERRSVNFENNLEIVGFQIEPQALTRGTKPVLKTYYRVLRKISRSYRVFLHVDRIGSSTRIHGDHWMLNLVPESEDQDDCIGCYATNHWKKGDIVVDTYTLDVPIGSPAGDYDIWMGLYAPGGGRMKVSSFDEKNVKHDGSNRVSIGKMTVR